MEYEGVTKRHLDGKEHKTEANMPDKYSGVDKLIKSGISLKQFVDRVNKRHKVKPARLVKDINTIQHCGIGNVI